MNHLKITALWLLLFIPLVAMAKGEPVSYVVSKVSGRVEVITTEGKRQVEKGDVLKGDAVLNVSFSGQLTLLAENGDKQFVINSPGKATVSSFVSDKRNTVLTLTKDYVKSVVAQLRKDKSVKARRHSDPATVTREIIVKDSALIADSVRAAENDTTQCEHCEHK